MSLKDFQIFVSGLPYESLLPKKPGDRFKEFTREELLNPFSQFGEVIKVGFVRNKRDLQSGCGFVTYKTQRGMQDAIAAGTIKIGSRIVHIEKARPRKEDLPLVQTGVQVAGTVRPQVQVPQRTASSSAAIPNGLSGDTSSVSGIQPQPRDRSSSAGSSEPVSSLRLLTPTPQQQLRQHLEMQQQQRAAPSPHSSANASQAADVFDRVRVLADKSLADFRSGYKNSMETLSHLQALAQLSSHGSLGLDSLDGANQIVSSSLGHSQTNLGFLVNGYMSPHDSTVGLPTPSSSPQPPSATHSSFIEGGGPPHSPPHGMYQQQQPHHLMKSSDLDKRVASSSYSPPSLVQEQYLQRLLANLTSGVNRHGHHSSAMLLYQKSQLQLIEQEQQRQQLRHQLEMQHQQTTTPSPHSSANASQSNVWPDKLFADFRSGNTNSMETLSHLQALAQLASHGSLGLNSMVGANQSVSSSLGHSDVQGMGTNLGPLVKGGVSPHDLVSTLGLPEQKPRTVSPSSDKPEAGTFMKVQVQAILKGDECQVGVRKVDDALHAKWDAMITEMEMFYNDHQSKMKPIQRMEQGKLYAGFVDSIWFRVQMIDYGGVKDTANVLLVDFGDVDSLPFSAIYELESRFSSAPPQGMICNLYGLTSFAAHQSAYDSACKMMESEYDAYVVSSEPLSVVLYNPADGSDLNEWILSQVYENLLPEPLPRPGGSLDKALVTVSYVSSACDVYLRRFTQQTALVDALVSLAAIRVTFGMLPPAKTLSQDGVYLGHNDLHGWCRMTPLSPTPDVHGNVHVMLMDHGDVDFVSIESLRLLTTLSTVMTKLPAQAVRVSLARVPPTPNKTFTPQAAKKLREMAPQDSKLLLRVIETSKSGLPVVELFERLASNKVAMLNASLELDESLYKSPTSQHVMVPKASLPSIKSNFDVKVFNVVDPTNFYIHPLQTLPELITLARQLKDSRHQHSAVDPDAVVLGGYYIYWCPELLEFWRVQVMRKIGKFVEVSFIDHGGIQITPCNNLFHLSPEFGELPIQAIRARLYGVKPSDGDWSVQNVLFFKKFLGRVNTFTATVMDVMPDQTLVLHLFDRTGRNQVSVAQYLIDNFHASLA